MYYYTGMGDDEKAPEVFTTNFSQNGIRKLLLDKNEPQIKRINALKGRLNAKQISEEDFKKEAGKVKSDVNALMVLIKSDDKAKYKNLIDILDEMQITNVGKYAIVDITPPELEMIAKVPL